MTKIDDPYDAYAAPALLVACIVELPDADPATVELQRAMAAGEQDRLADAIAMARHALGRTCRECGELLVEPDRAFCSRRCADEYSYDPDCERLA